MKSPLRILYLEDNPADAELVQETLETDGITPHVTRVETETGFIAALEQAGFDLILADYTLPSFDGLSALKIARQRWPHVPFIFVSGTLDEEVAIEALKIGATDYVFKTRLSRIVPSVQRALREAAERDERRRAEEALRRSEAYLAEAQRLSHTGSFGWNVTSGEIYWSRETFRIFEYEPAPRVTLEFPLQRAHPEDRETVQQLIDRASLERTNFDFEHRLLIPDGSVKYVRVVGHPSENESGDFEFVGAVTDITEGKRAEEFLRRSEDHFRLLVDATPAMIYTARPDGHIDFLNQGWLNFLGLPLEDVCGWRWTSAFHPDDIEKCMTTWRVAIASGEPAVYEGRVRRADGEYRTMLHRKVPLRDGQGNLIKWYGSSTDIEELRLMEAGLRESEERFRTMADTLPEVLWITSLNPEQVLYVSPSFGRIWGRPSSDLYQNPRLWTEAIHPDDREEVVDRFTRWISGEDVSYDNVEYRVIQPGGAIRWIHERRVRYLNQQGKPYRISGISTDFTDRKRAEVDLQNALDEIKTLRDQLYKENIALREEVDKASMFEEIVGESPALQAVLARVAKVAPTDSTVLITGETGTGKELIARAIHKRSQRSSRAFVSVNCAAIPATLIASELFGHEKGAFTGALQRRLGRFELADGGTIFLDEIGELPPDTQVALLRVLQEREFERVGGSQPIRADVRVITATNRDLEAAITAGAFRKDLFYRLNVFPIDMPALRERKGDIATLVEYFIHRYSRKAGKKIESIEKKTLELLEAYSWPGNIRELQNVIERSVIVCESDLFSVDPSWLSLEAASARPETWPSARKSAADEKEIIEKVLAATGGRVSGPDGAAVQLGVPASTLESKIRSLRINKYRFKNS